MIKKKTNLTEGPVGKTIINLTLPMMIGMFSMVMFNLIDTFFISRLGTTPLAAMSFTFPVVIFMASISMGLGIGAAAVISHAIGTGDNKWVQRLTTDSLLLSITLVTLVVIIGLSTMDPLFRALGAEGETLILVKKYMLIWYMGMPFVVIPMVGNNAIRATGNTMIPSMIMLAAIAVNLVLDPLLIYGIGPFPRLELRGAAIATVIARSTTLLVSLYYLRYRFDMLTLHIPSFTQLVASWKKILYVGIPAALTQLTLPISMGIITRFVSDYGEAAVAAFGIGTRVEMFALSPIMSLSTVLIAFTGQNLGAGKIDRIEKGIQFSHRFSLALGFCLFPIFLLFGQWIAKLFNPDPEVLPIVVLYLVIVSIGYGFQGIVAITASAFSALNHPFHALALNTLRMIILYIPISLLASQYFGVGGIFSGASISSVIAGIISIFWVRSIIKSIS
ncbi:MATE family efflux transporter [Candidatus Latescibacterota bacterium]